MLLLLLFCFLAAPVTLRAQSREAGGRESVAPPVPLDSVGSFARARVRLDARRFSFEGKPLCLFGDTLTLLGSARDRVKIPVDHIRRLEVSMGAMNRGSSTIVGALIGGASGFGLTWGISYLYYEQAGYSEIGRTALAMGVGGAAVGGLVGALTGYVLRGPDWREVRLTR